MYIFPVSINILIVYSHAIPNSSHKKNTFFSLRGSSVIIWKLEIHQ